MNTLFTPEYKVLNELFGRDTRYIIPEYQRPYSWDCIGKSDKNNQVNVMWEDLITYFEDKNSNPYFFGSMVLVGNGAGQEYQVIDGQQRLTTLTILFVAIKCFLKQSEKRVDTDKQQEIKKYIQDAIVVIDDIIFNKKIFGAITQEKKVKIEKITGFDYDKVFKVSMECGEMKDIDIDMKSATDEQQTVSRRYFENRNYFEAQLKQKFWTNDTFSYYNASQLNNFIEFLKQRVAVVRILASKFDVAYQVFEILNNRGLPLSNKDLFRNFVIREFHELKESDSEKYAYIDPNKEWRELEDNFDLENEFISRWVESRKATNQQYSAFNDLKDLFENHYESKLDKSKIEVFMTEIKKDLANYTRIVNLDIADKKINSKLQVILNAGNSTYTMNLLLSLFRNCNYDDNNLESKQKIVRFLNAYETYLLYLLLGPAKRFSSKPIYDAIKSLNQQDFEKAIKGFYLEKNEMIELRKLIEGDIKDNMTAKLFIAKYFWIEESQQEDDLIEQKLDFDKCTLEHIIPQNPESQTNWMTEFSEEFRKEMTYKLGNMTLLTKKKNSAAKNYGFEVKKMQYKKTGLALTRTITEQGSLSQDFFRNRQSQITTTILKDLGITTDNI